MEVVLASGHRAAPLEGEERARQERAWRGCTQGLLRLSPGRWLFPTEYTHFADTLYNFEVHTRNATFKVSPGVFFYALNNAKQCNFIYLFVLFGDIYELCEKGKYIIFFPPLIFIVCNLNFFS